MSWLQLLKLTLRRPSSQRRAAPASNWLGGLNREQVSAGLAPYRERLAAQRPATRKIMSMAVAAKRSGNVDLQLLAAARATHITLEALADDLQAWIDQNQMRNETDENRSQKLVDDILDVSAMAGEAADIIQDILDDGAECDDGQY